MELRDGRITILINQDGTTIELKDNSSYTTFVKIELTPDQLSSALSRLGETKCKIKVFALDKLNKKMINKDFEFEIPEFDYKEMAEKAYEIAKKLCPEGWIPDGGFNSQGSFFKKDGKNYAKTIIRTWLTGRGGDENDPYNI
jgi:hypothetical protein